jgi:phage recombination protein Bet
MFSPSQIDLLKSSLYPNVPDDQMKLFVATCDRTGLDPFARQIYMVERKFKDQRTQEWKSKYEIQASIDGLRVVAERTGHYQGQDGPYWCGKDGQWKDVWLDAAPPMAAKIGVLKGGFSQALWSVAKWDSYAQISRDGKMSPMWKKMPDLMLAKCAEALALRRAFPNQLSGIYTGEEMAQADNPVTSSGPQTSPPPSTQGEPKEFAEARERRIKAEEEAKRILGDTPPDDAPLPEQMDPLDQALESSGPTLTEEDFSYAQSRSGRGGVYQASKLAERMGEKMRPPPGPGHDEDQDFLTESAATGTTWMQYKIPFGKHTGKKLSQLGQKAVKQYADWLTESARAQDKPMSQNANEFCAMAAQYLSIDPNA